MSSSHFVTHPEKLSIQAPGIARLAFSLADTIQPPVGNSNTFAEPVRQVVVDLVMPVDSLLQLHAMLTQALAELEKKGLIKRSAEVGAPISAQLAATSP